MSDGSWWDLRQCERCDAITTAIMARTRAVVELHLDCGETWIEAFGDLGSEREVAAVVGARGLMDCIDELVPLDVQDLAFELPGDRGQS